MLTDFDNVLLSAMNCDQSPQYQTSSIYERKYNGALGWLSADRTNGRAIGIVLRLSVAICRL